MSVEDDVYEILLLNREKYIDDFELMGDIDCIINNYGDSGKAENIETSEDDIKNFDEIYIYEMTTNVVHELVKTLVNVKYIRKKKLYKKLHDVLYSYYIETWNENREDVGLPPLSLENPSHFVL